jgi:hypothetical protein
MSMPSNSNGQGCSPWMTVAVKVADAAGGVQFNGQQCRPAARKPFLLLLVNPDAALLGDGGGMRFTFSEPARRFAMAGCAPGRSWPR